MNELTMILHPKSDVPLYEQIYRHMKADIQSGKIASGEKLPSTRSLCKYLEVSRSTVELAYEQLLSEGYVEAVRCKGYYAAQLEGMYRLSRAERRLGTEEKRKEKQYTFDFTPNGVDLKSFPYSAWRKISRECLVDDRAEMFRLGESQGEYGLRSAISHYLYQARGVNCLPEQIVIGAGNDYLLMLLTTVIGSGHRVALENPTYRQAYRLFRSLSYDVCTVNMDGKGMEVTGLRQSDADIAFVMPSHQYPLGIVMPMKRRMELLGWASEKPGRYIIEDDYDSEFRYKGKPIPALQGYDSSEKVIYMGTFSKSIAPAIRISYMVLPAPLLERYREKSSFLSSTVSRVDQMILQKFIEEGYYERHLNKTRALYKSRHDTLLGCLRQLQGQCTVSGENAGVHLLLHFHNGMSEEELIDTAAAAGVKVYGLSEYYTERCYAKRQEAQGATILIGYANMSEDKIVEAVRILAKVWSRPEQPGEQNRIETGRSTACEKSSLRTR